MVVVIASENKGKIKEFKRILKPLGFDVIYKFDAGMNTDILETGSSFEENAKIKAIETYKVVNMPVIADDSGLEVLALNGAPGIYSARYSADNGFNATAESNNNKLLKIGRISFDEKSLIRAAIMKLIYSIKKITKY